MSVQRKKKRSKPIGKLWNPHDYQVRTVAKAIRERYLAHFLDPGLGKTTIILWIYSILKYTDKSQGILVIAPLRPAFLVWPAEIKKWSNFSELKVTVLHKDWPGNKEENLWDSSNDVFVINPEGLPWLLEQLKGKRKVNWPFNVLAVDESTKFKNMSSKRWKLLKKIIAAFHYRYILTGTPVPNGLINIQGQFFIVDQGEAFGWQQVYFREKYFKQIGRPEWKQFVPRKDKVETLYKKVARRTVRLKGSDYLKLPQRLNNIIWVDLPKKARKHYDEIENELFTIINGDTIDTPTAASVNAKCHQIANGCLYKDEDPLLPKTKGQREFYILHQEKLDALESLRDELDKPIFIGYRFKHDLIQLKKRFGKKLITLDGVSMKAAAKIEKDWNKGKIEMLAAYPGSNALGLNLQESGQDVVWYSQIDDLEAEDQFIKRLERQGSKHKYIRNHMILARDTVDEIKRLQLEKKAEVQDNFLARVAYYAKQKRSK